MTVAAACLLLYSLVVVLIAPRLLCRATATGRAPLLGIATWLTAITTVLASWLVAAALIVTELIRSWGEPLSFLASCLRVLRTVAVGNAGMGAQIGLLVLAGSALTAIAITTVRLMWSLTRMRKRSHAHASGVRLIGEQIRHRAFAGAVRRPVMHTVVVQAPQPAAYCIPGRPATIVVTSAAVAALTEQQLAAVLAHERAHLAGRHPQLVAALRALAVSFSALSLMRDAARQIPRLLEMRADDIAAREHGAAPLLTGLLALTEAAAKPSTALSAAGLAVLERAQRLAAGNRDRNLLLRSSLLLALGGLAIAPLMIGGLAIFGALPCI